MKKLVSAALLAGALMLGSAGAASAHNAGPCNDTDGDGMPSGQEYAEHHIAFAAQEGALGHGGHKPGEHQGFSLCLPTGSN